VDTRWIQGGYKVDTALVQCVRESICRIKEHASNEIQGYT